MDGTGVPVMSATRAGLDPPSLRARLQGRPQGTRSTEGASGAVQPEPHEQRAPFVPSPTAQPRPFGRTSTPWRPPLIRSSMSGARSQVPRSRCSTIPCGRPGPCRSADRAAPPSPRPMRHRHVRRRRRSTRRCSIRGRALLSQPRDTVDPVAQQLDQITSLTVPDGAVASVGESWARSPGPKGTSRPPPKRSGRGCWSRGRKTLPHILRGEGPPRARVGTTPAPPVGTRPAEGGLPQRVPVADSIRPRRERVKPFLVVILPSGRPGDRPGDEAGPASTR